MFAMFFNVVFAVFVCYPAAFCQLCFYNKDWIGLGLDDPNLNRLDRSTRVWNIRTDRGAGDSIYSICCRALKKLLRLLNCLLSVDVTYSRGLGGPASKSCYALALYFKLFNVITMQWRPLAKRNTTFTDRRLS